MTYPKRRAPAKPTKAAIQAAINFQRPLGQDAVAYVRKKPRRWKEDEISDLGKKRHDAPMDIYDPYDMGGEPK